MLVTRIVFFPSIVARFQGLFQYSPAHELMLSLLPLSTCHLSGLVWTVLTMDKNTFSRRCPFRKKSLRSRRKRSLFEAFRNNFVFIDTPIRAESDQVVHYLVRPNLVAAAAAGPAAEAAAGLALDLELPPLVNRPAYRQSKSVLKME